jgi:predicted dehydrogenase
VVGLGVFGESHLRAYRALPEVEIAGVASRSAERAREVAQQYGVPKHFAGYEALIADPTIDAISVTTAEMDHRAPVIAALEAGKAVLVEKPIATTLEDAEAMLAAAERTGGLLMPAHVVRFNAKYAALQAAVARGEVGEVVAITTRRHRSRRVVASHGRAHPALVTSIHDLDIMLWVSQSEVRTVRAVHRLAKQPGQPHGIWALLTFANGVVGLIESGWMVPDKVAPALDDAFTVVGTAGEARIASEASGILVAADAVQRRPDISYEADLHGSSAGALKEELAHFVARVRDPGRPPVVTASDGVAALRVALAMIASAEQDTEITLSPSK